MDSASATVDVDERVDKKVELEEGRVVVVVKGTNQLMMVGSEMLSITPCPVVLKMSTTSIHCTAQSMVSTGSSSNCPLTVATVASKTKKPTFIIL